MYSEQKFLYIIFRKVFFSNKYGQDNFGSKRCRPPQKSLEMPHYTFCPQKNLSDFQNQRYINSYNKMIIHSTIQKTQTYLKTNNKEKHVLLEKAGE